MLCLYLQLLRCKTKADISKDLKVEDIIVSFGTRLFWMEGTSASDQVSQY